MLHQDKQKSLSGVTIGEIFYNVLIKFPVVWWRQKTRFKIYTRTLNKMTTRTLYNVTVLKLIGNLKKSLIFLKQMVFSIYKMSFWIFLWSFTPTPYFAKY